MKCFKLIKVLLFVSIFYLSSNCGYQPLFNKDSQSFSISSYNLEGNKRISSLLKNNLVTIKKDENLLILNINSKKKTAVADKNLTGKVVNYALTLDFEISASNTSNNVIFSKVYTKTRNYASSDLHSDTLNNEKKLVESLTEAVASELQNDLNSIFTK
tara:strand:+ start:1116 stop:1589 length:474 start_codon:yes stop_codon:yes gene_type:complete